MNSKPRGKNKVQNPYTMKDMYLSYIEGVESSSPYYVTFQEYLDICGDYYKELSSQLIDKSRVIKLPFRLGHVYVGKKKPKVLSNATLSTDWKESKRLGRWIHHIDSLSTT